MTRRYAPRDRGRIRSLPLTLLPRVWTIHLSVALFQHESPVSDAPCWSTVSASTGLGRTSRFLGPARLDVPSQPSNVMMGKNVQPRVSERQKAQSPPPPRWMIFFFSSFGAPSAKTISLCCFSSYSIPRAFLFARPLTYRTSSPLIFFSNHCVTLLDGHGSVYVQAGCCCPGLYLWCFCP